MRVTKAEVIKTASDMADRNGLHNVSLKAIAENLGIRTPSLYNHIGSLDELLREIAHSGMRTMNEKMIRAAIGKTGDSALKLVAVEYLNYMIEHPGVYEIIQWASWNGTEETAIIFNDYLSLLKTLICSCGFNPDKTTEILSMVTGMLHGGRRNARKDHLRKLSNSEQCKICSNSEYGCGRRYPFFVSMLYSI